MSGPGSEPSVMCHKPAAGRGHVDMGRGSLAARGLQFAGCPHSVSPMMPGNTAVPAAPVRNPLGRRRASWNCRLPTSNQCLSIPTSLPAWTANDGCLSDETALRRFSTGQHAHRRFGKPSRIVAADLCQSVTAGQPGFCPRIRLPGQQFSSRGPGSLETRRTAPRPPNHTGRLMAARPHKAA